MKDYLVRAIIDFNDTDEKTSTGADTLRKANESVWECTKERYEFLKSKKAVELVGITKKEETKKEVKEEATKKEMKAKNKKQK